MRKVQCLGKTTSGSRCTKKFLVHKDSEQLTCYLHKDQNVQFTYSGVKQPCKLHDIADLIAKEIHDAKTFNSFAKVCLSTAKACHKLQFEKKKEFAIWVPMDFLSFIRQTPGIDPNINIPETLKNKGQYLFPNGKKTFVGDRSDNLLISKLYY